MFSIIQIICCYTFLFNFSCCCSKIYFVFNFVPRYFPYFQEKCSVLKKIVRFTMTKYEYVSIPDQSFYNIAPASEENTHRTHWATFVPPKTLIH